jgi:hypothetical protein
VKNVFLCLLMPVLAGFAPALAAQPPGHRFVAVDVYLTSPEPVAAWQFELRSDNATIVGVENGESRAFRDTPYYDREAVERGDAERIIVADYSLEEPRSLPSGRVRIATLHLLLADRGEPEFDLELVTAVTHDGEPIDAAIGLEGGEGETP